LTKDCRRYLAEWNILDPKLFFKLKFHVLSQMKVEAAAAAADGFT